MDEDLRSSRRGDRVSNLPVREVVPLIQMKGEDEEDAALRNKMAGRARAYLLSFEWCASVLESYYGDGIVGIVAVFLFRILPSRPDVDEWLWVVVGDLPAAHFVIDDIKTPYDVLDAYIWHRSKWVKFAEHGKEPPLEVMPVGFPATPERAEQLNSRLKFLNKEILPYFRKGPTIRTQNKARNRKRRASRARPKV